MERVVIMKRKIRVPRKKKKIGRIYSYKFPQIPRINRYLDYLIIEDGIKHFGMTAEELCGTFGRYIMDEVIWWNWVRSKELGIKPEMSSKYKKYWDYFVKEGIIRQL